MVRLDAALGTVRVTCSEVVGAEVLPAIFAELRRSHPKLQIELSLTNANEDLLRREADVAVRMAQPTQSALIAKRVGAVKLGVFASEAYLANSDGLAVRAAEGCELRGALGDHQ